MGWDGMDLGFGLSECLCVRVCVCVRACMSDDEVNKMKI